MSVNMYAYVKEGNVHNYAPSEHFSKIAAVHDNDSFLFCNTPVRKVLIEIFGSALQNHILQANVFFISPMSLKFAVSYLSGNRPPVNMSESLYNDLIQFLTICCDNNFVVAIL